jgi:hypothetical protein
MEVRVGKNNSKERNQEESIRMSSGENRRKVKRMYEKRRQLM